MIFNTFGGKVSVRTQQYRLDDEGAFFDMIADPGQTADVSAKEPAVAQRLRQAATDCARGLAGKEGRPPLPGRLRRVPDHAATGPRRRPARRGAPQRPAPNCSYFVNWRTKEDSMTWDIDVQTAGAYSVEIQYAVPEKDVGATIELRFQNQATTGKTTAGWYPALIDNQDRVPRKGESYMREFRTMALPPLTLAKGRGALTLRAHDIPGAQVMEVRGVTLTLVR